MTSPEKLATPEINHASAETAKVVEQAIGALADILGGWRYIRQSHGDLYGVGWDRCEKSASIAIAALRAEVEALATQRQGEGDGWQPIETAPKDGRTLLLGYFNSHGKWRTLRGQWFSEAHINENWEEECEEGWYETSVECDDDVNCWKTEPTHFMFLPAAPGATSQGVAVAQPDAPPCETCNGNGMIGGPCYREPDEGGVPCPDCGPAGAAQGEVK